MQAAGTEEGSGEDLPRQRRPPPADPGSGLRASRLVGRREERSALDHVLAEARDGRSRTLVLRGEAGVGKTALLQYLAEHSQGCRIAPAVGVEAEMELAFAGIQQLCSPFLDRLDGLPGPQREALGTAFGLREGDAPDRFLVGLAVLTLLSEAARERPVICVVDDAQWWDRASRQALAFVARRLAADAVAVVLAVRRPGDEKELSGLPELVVDGLVERDARILLDSVITAPLDERVRDRIVAETRGNPLALLELPRGLTPEQLAGGFLLPGTAGLSGRIAESFRRRLASLPPLTRQLLLLVAAEPGQDPVLVWRAADSLGIDVRAAEPAVSDGLVEFGGKVEFCHPLARSTVYRAATSDRRRGVHRALADATDPEVDPERRAWHRAQATLGLDESVASELERSAARALARGGVAAAAAFRERAAELTPDPASRAERALAAAQAKHEAGAPDRALRLLAIADSGPHDDLISAKTALLRAQIAVGTDVGHAPLLAAAERLERLDHGLARETYRDAFYAALTAGRLASHAGMQEVARAVRAAPASPHPCGGDVLLDGLAALITDGYATGTPILQTALTAFRDGELSTTTDLRWLPLACRMSHDVWDDETWHVLTSRLIALARTRGALSVLPVALLLGVAEALFVGDTARAAAMVEEGDQVARATGNPVGPYGAVVLAAWRGREAETERLIAATDAEMSLRGEGQWITTAAWATALLHNGLGNYDRALVAAEQGSEYPDELGLATWSMVELVEAAARRGSPARADAAMRRLSEVALACGTDWALGVEARSRALRSEVDVAETHYREAIERLSRTRVRSALGRAHLLYGEWLRRRHRRVDARQQLRLAHDLLGASGAEAFAERARRELLATGETVRRRDGGTVTQLTDQEANIVRLVVDGRTNPEIGVQLFLSARTVEWHLRKIFSKLGVGSRKDLRNTLPVDRSGAR